MLYLLAIAAILLLIIWRPFSKKDPSGLSSAIVQANAVERKEIRQEETGPIIVPTETQETSGYGQKYKTAYTLIAQQRIDEAIAIFKELLAIPQEEEAALVNLGACYNLKDDMENAMYTYKKALDINERNYDALLGLGNFNYKTKQYPLAVVYYQKANLLRPGHPDSYWGLACAYYMMNEDSLASENAKAFVNLVPGSRDRMQMEKMIIS
jgi:tetratricopeptide (TPR) repeat protein